MSIEAGVVLQKTIYDAYESSANSDADLVFTLVLDHPKQSSKQSGAYEFIPSKLGRYKKGIWVFSGYEIHARDVAGLNNGAREIVKALQAGRDDIFNIQSGMRKGLVAKPLLTKEYPKNVLEKRAESKARGKRPLPIADNSTSSK